MCALPESDDGTFQTPFHGRRYKANAKNFRSLDKIGMALWVVRQRTMEKWPGTEMDVNPLNLATERLTRKSIPEFCFG